MRAVKSWRQFKVAYLGYGLIWTSNLSCFQSTALFAYSAESMELINVFFLVSLVASVLMHFAFAYLYFRFPSAFDIKSLPLVVSAFMSLGYCAVWLSGYMQNVFSPILIAGAIMHGIGWAWFDVAWLGLYGRIEPSRSRFYIFLSFIISFVLWFIIVKLVECFYPLGLAFNLVVIALSGVLLESGLRGQSASGNIMEQRPDQTKVSFLKKTLWQPLIGAAAFSLVYAFLDRVSSTNADYFNWVHTVSIFACMIGVIVLFVATVFLKQKTTLESVTKIVGPLLVIGCLLFPAFGGFTGVVPAALVAAGFMVFDIMMVAFVAELAYEYKTNGAIIEGVVRGIVWAFCGIGGAIGYYSIPVDLNIVVSLVISLALIYLIILGSIMILTKRRSSVLDTAILAESQQDNKASDSLEPVVDKGNLHDRTLGADIIATGGRYGLTRREEEVLSYLIRGRSLVYISKDLMLSEHTVRTHIRHIYEKTGVHSKQEIIDLVEGCRKSLG